MTRIDRRTLIAALAALGASGAASAAGPLDAIDPAGVEAIGKAWLAAQPRTPPLRALEAELFPRGRADLTGLSARVRRDFREGRLFTYRGWRLSDTEGRLFALLALSRRM
jgi:hypothetical protein